MIRKVQQQLLLTSLFVFLLFTSVFAQTTVAGKVTGADGDGIMGVNVVEKGGKNGTITDIDGNYNIKVANNATLVFSFIGYNQQEIAVGNNSTLNVLLEEDTKQLSEVIVTAFGISKQKKALSYAAQEVNSDQIMRSNEQNTLNALQGKVAGAFITASSGAPGAGTSIVLRGLSSLNPGDDNQPLIVLDGIIISNSTNVSNVLPSAGTNATGNAEQFSNTNRLADINPNEIENVSVLKGPAATALYGSLAMNGAIVITTKQGSEGKPKITYSFNYGQEEVNKTPPIQTQFREGTLGRIRVNPDNSVSTVKFQDYGPYTPNIPYFDNFKGLFGTGTRLTNNISIRGGTKNFTYALSGGNTQNEGILPGTSYNRSTASINATYQAFDWLKLSTSMTYSNTDLTMANGGDKSVMSALSFHSNTFDVNDYQFPDGSIKSYAGTTIDNPRWLAQYAPNISTVNRYAGQIAADIKLLSWLTARYQIGLDQYTDIRKRVMPGVTDVGFQVNGFVVNQSLQNRILNSNFLLRANKKVSEDITISGLLGNSILDKKLEEVGQRGEGLLIPQFYDITNAASLYPLYDFTQDRLIGAFGEVAFDYKNWLTLTATARNDWTSTLPDGNNSFFYPSVGMSFIWTDALKLDEKIFSYGKIRANYGETGQGTGAYRVGTYFGSANRFPFGTTPGFSRSSIIGDPNLRPLRTKGVEVGFEARFFNRFGFDISYYDQRTIDQIFSIPISNGTGFSAYVTNSGEVKNSGIEITASVTPIKRGGFEWVSSVNFSKNVGKVISTAPGIDQVEVYSGAGGYIVNRLVPGGRVGDLYGFNFLKDSASGQTLIDANGYPRVNSTALTKVGNALPDFIAAFINSFDYKGFKLSTQVEWRSGGDVYDGGRRNSIRNGNIKMTEVRSQLVVFKGIGTDGQPNTKEVEVNGENFYRSGALYNVTADMLLQDASWVRLRNVSLSYTLPKAFLKKAKLGAATLSLTGTNLWLNTPYVGFDPEAIQTGAGSNGYGFAGLTIPSVRSVAVGLSVTF
jgi:TonB-linked SusC/RagA family outer membrane protein